MSFKLQVIPPQRDPAKTVARNRSGMAAILTVVIVGAAVLIMAKSVSLSAVDDVIASANMAAGQKAMVLAEGCAEEILRRIELDPGYTADNYILTRGDGECVVNAVMAGGRYTIDILGRVDDYYRRLRVVAEIESGEMLINGWEETN